VPQTGGVMSTDNETIADIWYPVAEVTPAMAEEDQRRLESLPPVEHTTSSVLATLGEMLPAMAVGHPRRSIGVEVKFGDSGMVTVVASIHGMDFADGVVPVAAAVGCGERSDVDDVIRYVSWTTPKGAVPSVRLTAYLPRLPVEQCCECGK